MPFSVPSGIATYTNGLLKDPIAFTNMYKTLNVSSNSLQTYIKNNPEKDEGRT